MMTHRYIARFIIEAETPLFVGSGQASLLKDALVQKDVTGFPMILGTSLAGVIRHALASNNWINQVFGFAEKNKVTGSLLKVSSAQMILNNGLVSEGIMDDIDANLLNRFNNLPSRQHVRITEKSVAADKGLFDNEVVYKGVRFMFELELKGTAEDKMYWDSIINQVQGPTFRIGSGTRNGYGSLKVIAMFNQTFNLQDESDFNAYIKYDPSFNSTLKFNNFNQAQIVDSSITKYSLRLKPDSFFIFSEGFGDEGADNRPLEEEIVVYENDIIKFEKQTVIPASSIKGAISHRVAFHYNRLTDQFADQGKGKTGIDNQAVAELFGKAGQDAAKKAVDAQAGKVFINDLYYSEDHVANNKIFNHVAIDRFTGGAMDGALFSEKVTNLLGNEFNFDVYLKYAKDDQITHALECALTDICKGLLPLGGMTTKGHGMFTGRLLKNENELYNYENQNL